MPAADPTPAGTTETPTPPTQSGPSPTTTDLGAVETDDDLTSVQSDRGDGKPMVPVGVVQQLREERRQLRDQVKTLTSKASKVDELTTWAQQISPLIQAVKARPDIARQLLDPNATPSQPSSPSSPSAPAPDDADTTELKGIAEDLDLYRADGQPDLDRARRMRDRIQSNVASATAPLAQSQTEASAAQHYAWMLRQPTPSGAPVDKTILDNIVSRVPREDLANPEMASNLWMMAVGAQALKTAQDAGPTPPPADEPLVTESSGGEPPASLTSRQKSIAKEIGVSEADLLKNIQTAVEADGVLE